MRDTVQMYRQALQGLLPHGAVWPREPESVLARLLDGLATEFARVDGRGQDLRAEADPRLALELLAEWERLCGLPDQCSALTETLQERRAAVVARITDPGGQRPRDLINLAADLGYSVTITEHRAFTAGSRAGDRCQGAAWVHAFSVGAPETTTREFRAGASAAGEPLRKWGNAKLECAITQAKPAHTHAIFSYGG